MFILLIPDGDGLWILVMVSLFAISNRPVAMRIVMVFKKFLPYLFMANSILTAIFTGLIIHEQQQLYPTVISFTRSTFVLNIYRFQCILCIFVLAVLLKRLFFGYLYESEWNHVFVCFSEALAEASFVLTIFRRSVNSSFISVLILLLFLKTFHWIVAKRIDTFQRNLTDDLSSHLGTISMWLLLLCIDFVLLSFSSRGSEKTINTVSMTIFLEVLVMTISLVKAIMQHFLVLTEILAIRRGNEFRLKTVLLLLVTVLIDGFKLLVYLAYTINMVYGNVVPLFLANSISFVLNDFVNDIKSVVQGCQAIRYMRNCPNAQHEDLLHSNLCPICHDEMTNSAKKLPCGHIFHRTCLIFWFMRQQSCPICRFGIRQNFFGINLNIFNRAADNGGQPAAPTTHNAQTFPVGTAANNISIPMPSDNITMPFIQGSVPFIYPFYVPESFTKPLNLENYTDEQLEALEKTMLANVVQKLNLMGDIITHLDAANQLMSVYKATLVRTESAQQGAEHSDESSTT